MTQVEKRGKYFPYAQGSVNQDHSEGIQFDIFDPFRTGFEETSSFLTENKLMWI